MDKDDIKWLVNVLINIIQIILMIVFTKPKQPPKKKKPHNRSRRPKHER